MRALDLGVPQELSIVGFNDSATFGWWGNGVTSIGLPVLDIAVAFASGLLGTLARNPSAAAGAASQPSRAKFAPFLVERGSAARVAPRTARHRTA